MIDPLLSSIIDFLDRINFWDDDTAITLHIEEKCFAFITVSDNSYGYLRYIYTLPANRNNKIGASMMSLLTNTLQKTGVNKLAFFSRIESVGFYEKLGYSWVSNGNPNKPLYYGNLDKNLIYPVPAELIK